MPETYTSLVNPIRQLRDPIATGFLGYWAANKIDFHKEACPFPLDFVSIMKLDGPIPYVSESGKGVKQSSTVDLNKRRLDQVFERKTVTAVMADVNRCVQSRQPIWFSVVSYLRDRPVPFHKLYLPYGDSILSLAWTMKPGAEVLTKTERLVAELAAQGLPYREIASVMGVSTGTVDVHLRSIRRKLGINSKAQLAALMN